MDKPKPFVAAATACDQVILGADGAPSLIRMIDIVNLEPIQGLAPGAIGIAKLTLFVALRSTELAGEYPVEIIARYPTKGLKSIGKPISLFRAAGKGESVGANLIMQLEFAVEEFGMHWFDVMWDDDRLTSIPVKLVLKGATVQSPNPIGASKS